MLKALLCSSCQSLWMVSMMRKAQYKFSTSFSVLFFSIIYLGECWISTSFSGILMSTASQAGKRQSITFLWNWILILNLNLFTLKIRLTLIWFLSCSASWRSCSSSLILEDVQALTCWLENFDFISHHLNHDQLCFRLVMLERLPYVSRCWHHDGQAIYPYGFLPGDSWGWFKVSLSYPTPERIWAGIRWTYCTYNSIPSGLCIVHCAHNPVIQ